MVPRAWNPIRNEVHSTQQHTHGIKKRFFIRHQREVRTIFMFDASGEEENNLLPVREIKTFFS